MTFSQAKLCPFSLTIKQQKDIPLMKITMMQTIAIALAGAAGTLLRYWIGIATLRWSQHLPWGTILINVVGSFIIAFVGVIMTTGSRYHISDTARLAIMVGFCGGFTTFSSFSLQSLDLIRNGTPVRALLNIGLSVVLGMLSVTAGFAAGQTLLSPPTAQPSEPS